MSSHSKTTQDHEEIKKWAEKRGGVPATVAATHKGDDPGLIRLMFPKAPHHNDDKLEEISWDDFFAKFDERGLAMILQEKTADGEISNFHKIIAAESEK